MRLLPRSLSLPSGLTLCLLASALFHTAWLSRPWGTAAQALWYADLSYLAVIYLSTALAFGAYRSVSRASGTDRSKTGRRAAGTLAAALLALSAGESIWVYFEVFTDVSPAVSSADLCYYLFYVLLGLTLLRQAGLKMRSANTLGLLLDSTIIVGTIGLYAWFLFLAGPALDPATPLLVRAVTVSYPALDLGLLVLILLALRGRRLTASPALFAAGLLTYIVADLTYTFLSSRGTYLPGSPVDGLWTWGTALAAIGGSLYRPPQGQAQHEDRLPPARLQQFLTALPYLAVLASCGLLLYGLYHPSESSIGVGWGTVLLLGLAMLRQALTFRENARLTRALMASGEQLARSQGQLTHQAFHDVLTNLPNRALLRDRLEQALALATRHQHHLAVLCIDLDGFKLANDRLGHAAGDALLIQAALRMKDALREGDTLARVGGDEFTVVLTNMENTQNADQIASRLLYAFSRPFQLGHEEARVTASIGMSLYARLGETAEQLQRQADLALYRAKASGKSRVVTFTPDLATAVHARERLKQELMLALQRQELELYYQPQFRGRRLIGVEALLRWHSAALGPVPPDQFISVAEDTGLIFPIGRWVLEQACGQAAAWRAGGLPLRMAVNISPRQFAHPGFVAEVAAVLRGAGLPSRLLELELTERLVVQDLQAAADKIRQVQGLGVNVALDDFGTGQSSLSHLMMLPVNALKIDRHFVANAEHSESGQGVIRAITAIAHALKLQVVAEGVETETQQALVGSLGCEVVQGYLFGRPMSAGQFEEWLALARSSHWPEPSGHDDPDR